MSGQSSFGWMNLLPARSWHRAIWLMCVAACVMTGCRTRKETTKPATPSVETQKQQVSLDPALSALQPEEFEFNVHRDQPVRELNAWADVELADLVSQDVEDEDFRKAMSAVLSSESVDLTLRRQFSLRDATFIRDAFWSRAIIEMIGKSVPDDRQRMVKCFESVIFNTDAWPSDFKALPLGPFNLMMFGRATAADRAWIFASLLRQRREQAVIVQPLGVETSDVPLPLIVGVVSGEDLLLFDVTTGLPIPGPQDDAKQPMIGTVATLKEVLANDSLLRAFDIREGAAYPLKSSHFQKVKLSVIGDTSQWSRRMEALQNGMKGKQSAILFEPLVNVGTYEGVLPLVEAAAKQSGVTAEIGIWNYPEAQREAREVMSEEQAKRFSDLAYSFQAPKPLIATVDEVDGKSVLSIDFQPGQNQLLAARLTHVMGRFSDAIPTYLKLQGWRDFPPSAKNRIIQPNPNNPEEKIVLPPAPNAVFVTPALQQQILPNLPPDVVELHSRAAREALLWRGMCQLSLGKYETASTDLEKYLQLPSTTPFSGQARYVAAIATAQLGNGSRGASFLRRLPETDERYRAARYLMHRWQAAAEGAKEQ